MALTICDVCDRSYTENKPTCPHCNSTTNQQIMYSLRKIQASREKIGLLESLRDIIRSFIK
jgi:transposase-like protein